MQKKNIFPILLLTAFLSLSYSVNAQLQASNWYFGFNAGINFDPSTGAVTALTDGQVSTNEGCASISDDNGQLLFYTDGTVVFDRSHQIMQNGQGLRGNPSSTQSAIIIPKPQDANIYYIFTVDLPSFGGAEGVHYYEVDMTLNNGFGAVTTSIANPPLLVAEAAEKLSAINHATNDEILVTTFANSTGFGSYDSFHTFTVGPTGVNPTPVISANVATPIAQGGGRRGNLKFSPDGRFLVSCNMSRNTGAGSYIYDFDPNTGIVSNERQLLMQSPNNNGYGVEFSPDGNLLYITATNDASSNLPSDHTSTLYQFALTARNLGGTTLTGIDVDTRQGYRGSLQLGIDGKIYRALADTYDIGRPFLGVINNPNVIGPGCNYQHDAIPLAGRSSTQGLPPFIQSFFALIEVENFCEGDGTLFSFQSDTPPDAILWEFGDGTTSTLESPTHIYANAGTYNVVLSLTTGGSTRVYRTTVEIYESPVANTINPIAACDENQDGRETYDLQNTATVQILGAQDPNAFVVDYFTNQTDADSNVNPITIPYQSSNAQETLVARIYNRSNEDCYETTSFDIELFEQPIANPVTDLEACDDDFDGIVNFNLDAQTSTILGSQNPSDFTVSYHTSQNDADLGASDLPLSYDNTTPFRETIFVRVENNQQAVCADTSLSFDLVVNPKPVANDFDAFQCDEDGVADGRTVFSFMSFDNAISNNATNVTVSYFINQSNADNNTNPLDNTNYTNLTPLQTIIARVTDNTTGCFNTSTVTLSVSASDAQNSSLSLCDNDGTEDGFTEFTLSNANADVLISAPSNVTVSYYESLNDALTEQNTLPDLYTNTIAGNQTVFARAESPDGNCFGISEVALTVNDLPVIETSEFFDYCGNNPQALTLDSGLITGTPSDYTYLWNTGETTESIMVTTGGDYEVTVSNLEGCSRLRRINVIISEPATITSIDTINAGTSSFGSATINVTGLGDYEYRLDPLDPYQDSPSFENLAPGFYTAYVRDRNGCGTTTQDFSIVGYPRFFTPNNDGFNDYWQLLGVSVVFEPNSEIFIFDRFGKLLKQVSPQGPGWDGTYNGSPLPSSDYWFKATLMDGTEFSSHFSLKR
ncbi:gliding motility-associated-like protein [Nonlabens dokdonensis]|uniref:Secreted protein containing PKD domain n=2 Tax=Nonlabens dokdonensis TaxID=328515 RepID=L7W7Z4_NONDD|nr:T9SS type B sorting domain-containing protein [Nonlabens dokdonensis]AGC77790.1 secreted protein containing PKD domain [Nonlabens dokdonensis DSW-6]PZX39676.1 gliding motility-associated-like protein [Nonlabens dokdonensis]